MSVTEEELIEEISGFLHGYLKDGKIKVNSFLSKMNLNISNIEQLLVIRFLLKDETIEFVKDLPYLLKRFKTTTVMNNETHIGEVRGQINWEQTTKERVTTNYRDRTTFSTTESVRSYNTPENLVLKQLLKILYSILYKDSYTKGFEHSSWFSEWQTYKGNVSQAIKKNIYLQRVDKVNVSDRIVQKTLNHRNRLYRDAAKLLILYRNYTNGQYSKEDLELLLRETFISPKKVDVLFELYWIVQIIKQNTENSQLHLMDGSQNLVASWETNTNYYKIYHDSTGSAELFFNVTSNEIAESNHPYLKQKHNSFTTSKELVQSVFGRTKSNYIWQGRPDFLVEVYEKKTDQLVKVVIGEVKNTSSIDYAITGLEELIDYIHLVKNSKGEYLTDNYIPIQGILCLGDLNFTNQDKLVKVVKINSELNLRI
ncbi:hypothetical protein [Aquisalibacillus elongatus]|uniref:Uncharacterized protein n=1 Tax=Aquisalibacillus elongatus TaxID=485577 RepID=A0A3N5C718_9BACI|nr:hypothetical protein [Aquisalibacillus elongatus]RPF55262.1 hypothetical protein EDC24_0133 [Aquisalibacillus elongatus]